MDCNPTIHCAPRGNRTPNSLIKSQVLYQLSYEGICGSGGIRTHSANGTAFTEQPNSPTLAHSRGRQGGIRTPIATRRGFYRPLISPTYHPAVVSRGGFEPPCIDCINCGLR